MARNDNHADALKVARTQYVANLIIIEGWAIRALSGGSPTVRQIREKLHRAISLEVSRLDELWEE